MRENEQKIINELILAAKTEIETITNLVPKCKNGELKAELLREQGEFAGFVQEGVKKLQEVGGEEKQLSVLVEAGSRVGIELTTFFNKSPGYFAQKLMEGNLAAVIKTFKILNNNKSASADLTTYAKKLADICEANIKKLRQFLI